MLLRTLFSAALILFYTSQISSNDNSSSTEISNEPEEGKKIKTINKSLYEEISKEYEEEKRIYKRIETIIWEVKNIGIGRYDEEDLILVFEGYFNLNIEAIEKLYINEQKIIEEMNKKIEENLEMTGNEKRKLRRLLRCIGNFTLKEDDNEKNNDTLYKDKISKENETLKKDEIPLEKGPYYSIYNSTFENIFDHKPDNLVLQNTLDRFGKKDRTLRKQIVDTYGKEYDTSKRRKMKRKVAKKMKNNLNEIFKAQRFIQLSYRDMKEVAEKFLDKDDSYEMPNYEIRCIISNLRSKYFMEDAGYTFTINTAMIFDIECFDDEYWRDGEIISNILRRDVMRNYNLKDFIRTSKEILQKYNFCRYIKKKNEEVIEKEHGKNEGKVDQKDKEE